MSSNAHRAHESAVGNSNLKDELSEVRLCMTARVCVCVCVCVFEGRLESQLGT